VRILREVANGAVGGNRPRVFGSTTAISFACEKTHSRRLTGTITADETDAHAFIDPEARMVDELTGPNAQ
jgi:lipoprotein